MPNTTYGSPYAQSSDLVSNWPGVSLNVADRLDDVSFKGNGLNDQTGTTYTLVLTDAGKTVTLNNASAVTVTVPTNASVAYETGTEIQLTNKGAGTVTISAAGGVTINNNQTIAQNNTATLKKLDTNTWVMVTSPAPGVNYVSASSFATVATISINSCFTSTYANYLILIAITAATANTDINFRLRASGTDVTTGYYYSSNYADFASNTGGYLQGANVGQLPPTYSLSSPTSGVLQVVAPQLSQVTSFHYQGINLTTNGNSRSGGGYLNNTNQYDGLTIYPTSGTISGSIRVYGYRNT